MEPQKRAKYSKPLEPDEIEEVLMDEESDEELEETDELMEPRVQFSSAEDEDNTEDTEVTFRSRTAGDPSNVFDFTGPPKGVIRSAASDIYEESSPFSISMLFFRQISQIILHETNRYIHNTGHAKENKGGVASVR
jgi:hypothetical protein